MKLLVLSGTLARSHAIALRKQPISPRSRSTSAPPSRPSSMTVPGAGLASAHPTKSITTSPLRPGLGSRPAASFWAPVLGRDPRPTPQRGVTTLDDATASRSHFKPETSPVFHWILRRLRSSSHLQSSALWRGRPDEHKSLPSSDHENFRPR